jgi:hypothetical protein
MDWIRLKRWEEKEESGDIRFVCFVCILFFIINQANLFRQYSKGDLLNYYFFTSYVVAKLFFGFVMYGKRKSMMIGVYFIK